MPGSALSPNPFLWLGLLEIEALDMLLLITLD